MQSRKATKDLALAPCHELQQNAALQGDLSPIQWRTITALASGMTITSAADASSVDRATVHRWLKTDADFVAALNRLRNEAVAALESELRELGLLAIKTMREMIASDNTPSAVRLRACLAALAVAEGAKLEIGWEDPEDIRSDWRQSESLATSLRSLYSRPLDE